MSDMAVPQSRPEPLWQRTQEYWRRYRWLLLTLMVISVIIPLANRIWRIINTQNSIFDFAIILATILSFLPALICFVQSVSRKRQLSKLTSLGFSPVSKTTLYQVAIESVDPGRLVVDADYGIPLILYVLVCFIGFMTILIAYTQPDLFSTPSVLLGGPIASADPAIKAYQLQTFVVISMAFFGSYISALSRILDRINNNDFYPISLYYYVARIVAACIVAGVLRHTFGVLGSYSDNFLPKAISQDSFPLLLLIGFSIGFAPDLFIVSMFRKTFQVIKTWGIREEPSKDVQPVSLPLLMIDDLSRDKIDRLNELEIDNAQALARQNPFRLLPRLPYDLGLIVDWIAQAQLYVLVRDVGLKKMREMYVRDVFDLYIRLEDEQARTELCNTLSFPEKAGKALLRQLETDASFLRLREVKEAMTPQSAPKPSPETA
ncbi:MAG: hypothetical protein JO007_20740 [Alphaproteobacteria bacterium]|nr:hypothetical protein [Alphaproteobacteria bacterium]